MDWGTFWSLLAGALFATSGGYVQGLLTDRRLESRWKADRRVARHLEQREALIELRDTAERWITTLDGVSLALASGNKGGSRGDRGLAGEFRRAACI